MVLARRWAGLSRASRARRDADFEGAARTDRSETAARSHRIVQGEQRRMAHVVPQQARPRTDASTQGVERACGGAVVRAAQLPVRDEVAHHGWALHVLETMAKGQT